MKTIFEGKKLYAVTIAFLLIITFLITFLIVRNHYQYVVKETIAENKLKAHFLSSLLYEHQKAAIGILESYARRPLFIDAVKKKDFHRALYHLKSLNENHTEMDALFITDKSGTVWANHPVSKESYGKNYAHLDWYKGVSKKWRPYISTIYRRVVLEKGLAVAIAVPVLDRKGKVVGILCGAQRTPFFATFIKGNTSNPEKSITLLDQEGNIIFSNAVPNQEKITKYPDARVLEKAGAGVLTDMEIADAKEKGGISYISIAPVMRIGWSVIVGQQKNAILKSLYGYSIRAAVIGFVIFLLISVSLLYFRREYKYRKTRELLRAEEKYRNIIENAVEGMSQTTPEGRFMIVNNAFARMLGYESPEDVMSSVTDIRRQLYVNPEQRKEALSTFDEKGVIKKYDAQLYRKDGSIGWFSINTRAVLDDAGNPLYYEGFVTDITERKKVEEALKESEEKFGNIFKNDGIGKSVTMLDGTMSVNPAFCQMLGYTMEELIHEKWQNITHPDDIELSENQLKQLRSGEKKSVRFIKRYLKKDGSIIWADTNVVLQKGGGDNPLYYITSIMDITGRKQAEEALRESEVRYHELFNNISSGVAIYEVKDNGHDFIFKDFNRAGERLDGNRKENIIGKSIYQARPGIEKFGLLNVFKRVWETGIPEYYPATFYEDERLKKWFENYVYKLPTGEIVAVYDDITERKEIEKALQQSEENFRRSLNDSQLGMRIVTMEGETIYANRAILDFYGYDSIEELRTTPIKNRYTPQSYAEFQIRKEKRRQGDHEPSEYEVNIVRKNGEVRHLQVLRKEILWDGERQFQAIYQDITERKRAEEEIRISHEQMRALAGRLQAVREEERTQIAREIHDELGGALTGLKIDFSLLTRAALKIENETIRTSLLARMNTMIEFINATIQTVRRIAMELRPGVLDDLGLVAALEWQLKDFEKRAGIRCEFFPPVEEISLDVDLSTALFRIFQEALTNVVRHAGATEVRVRLRADADFFTLEVEDNGKGIEKEKTLNSKSLGLLGMRERAQMFGGRLTVTGAPGTGTKVTVGIPPVEKIKMDRDQEGAAG